MVRPSTKRAHYLSIGVLVLLWAQSAHLSLTDQDFVRGIASSVSRLALYAGGHGLVVALVLFGLLRLSRESLGDIGFTSQHIGKQLGIGTLFGMALFLVHNLFISPVIDALVPASADQGVDLTLLFNNAKEYPIWILLAVLQGGLVEEGSRVFGITRFEKVFGKPGFVFAVIVGSMVFGLAHLYQGVDSAIATAIQAVLFILIYLRRRRTLEAVTAHAVYDIIGITIAYQIY